MAVLTFPPLQDPADEQSTNYCSDRSYVWLIFLYALSTAPITEKAQQLPQEP